MEAHSCQKVLIAEHFKKSTTEKKEVFKYTIYSHALRANQMENMQFIIYLKGVMKYSEF